MEPAEERKSLRGEEGKSGEQSCGLSRQAARAGGRAHLFLGRHTGWTGSYPGG